MHCPRLHELPPPPPGRTGWPWTTETMPPIAIRPTGRPWPRITITTPNYNGAAFLEETIRSILLQGYPDLEYIVMDAASKDGSVALIRKYARFITHWESEPDRGQSHAINKAFRRATGEIVNWINSDDLLTPGALIEVARRFDTNRAALVGGVCEQFGEGFRTQIVPNRALTREGLIAFWRGETIYQQPSLFVPRAAMEERGLPDEALSYVMDLEWYIRLFPRPVVYTKRVLSKFRVHGDSKTVSQGVKMGAERVAVSRQHWEEIGRARAERECAAFCRRDARLSPWNETIFDLLRSEGRRRTKILALLRQARTSPWRLARRETWGALARIIASA